MKEAGIIHDNLVVWHVHPNGQVGQPLMELKDVSGFTNTKCLLVDSTTGQQIFTVVKEEHTFHPDEYKAYAPNGAVMWSLSVDEHTFRPDEYSKHATSIKASCPSELTNENVALKIFQGPNSATILNVAKKVQGHERAIMLNGQPVATMDEPESLLHMRREDGIYVAAGMDIALAIGVAWAHYDKQTELTPAA
jgi:hypothetical protein